MTNTGRRTQDETTAIITNAINKKHNWTLNPDLNRQITLIIANIVVDGKLTNAEIENYSSPWNNIYPEEECNSAVETALLIAEKLNAENKQMDLDDIETFVNAELE